MINPHVLHTGDMDRVIDIIRHQKVTSGNGEMITQKVITLHAKLYARWQSRAGNERFEAEKQTAISRDIWETHYLGDVAPTDEITHDGAVYIIRSIEEIGRKEGQRFITERKQ